MVVAAENIAFSWEGGGVIIGSHRVFSPLNDLDIFILPNQMKSEKLN